MVPGGAGCLSQVVVEEEEEVEGADVEAAFCSPAPAQACRYGTPAVDTTTEELWVEVGADSEPSSAGEGNNSKVRCHLILTFTSLSILLSGI